MKKLLSWLLALVLCLSLCFSLSACDTDENSDDRQAYIGIWKNANSGEYMYIYKDGTGDLYGSYFTPSTHYNAFTWELEDKYFVRNSTGAFGGSVIEKYTLDGNCLLNSQGKVAFRKHSSDPSVDV